MPYSQELHGGLERWPHPSPCPEQQSCRLTVLVLKENKPGIFFENTTGFLATSHLFCILVAYKQDREMQPWWRQPAQGCSYPKGRGGMGDPRIGGGPPDPGVGHSLAPASPGVAAFVFAMLCACPATAAPLSIKGFLCSLQCTQKYWAKAR